jgi:hypothetical protein
MTKKLCMQQATVGLKISRGALILCELTVVTFTFTDNAPNYSYIQFASKFSLDLPLSIKLIIFNRSPDSSTSLGWAFLEPKSWSIAAARA